MRINRISNNINFGYNVKLNKRVNDRLKKDGGEYNQTVLDLNNYVNNLEEKTRKAELADKKENVADYSYLLVRLKPIVTEMIDDLYPKMKYGEKELIDYNTEVRSRKLEGSEHWLEDLAGDMAEYVCINRTINADDFGDPKTTTVKATEKPIQQTSAVAVDESAAKLLEKFVPNQYSPKGLDSLGGMEKIKEDLIDKIIYPNLHPEEAWLDEIEYGKRTPRGELFYGPPGCGKTSVIEAVAAETGFPLYKLKVGKSGSKYVNESSTNVQKAYEYVAAMAHNYGTPVFLAIDEMESMTSQRRGSGSGEDDKLVSTLLQIIEDARNKNVIILGATNCFNLVDEAVKSRFEDKIYIGLPDDDTRRQVLKIHLNKRTKGQNLAGINKELDKVVKMTKGFSNRDIAILVDKASLIARKDGRRDIEARDFEVPVKENQNMKVKEYMYQDSTKRATIGFS